MKFFFFNHKYFALSLFIISLMSVFLFADKKKHLPSHDSFINGLSSLIFHIHEYKKGLDSDSHEEKPFIFSGDEIEKLWNRVKVGSSIYLNEPQETALYKKAEYSYEKGKCEEQTGLIKQAKSSLEDASNALNQLFNLAMENEEKTDSKKSFQTDRILRIKDPNIENNPFISEEMAKAITPYLLPIKDPKRRILDSLFLQERITTNKHTFYRAGFRTIAKGPRSFILVAKHPKLLGYLVKAHLDNQTSLKFKKESWEWLVRRCVGARKIREIIHRRKIRFFTVPEKWMYCLPAEPSPPEDNNHTRHIAILLVTDMQLASEKENYRAWLNLITKEHLNELFEIIVRAKGASYRPDNIAYTENNTFAFIDTEYPSKGPDFKSIRYFLKPEMLDYWDRLLRNGGP